MLFYLKKSIILYILENINEFQLVNATIENFREYIYDDKGNYLMGGQEISDFIRDACKLLTNH